MTSASLVSLRKHWRKHGREEAAADEAARRRPAVRAGRHPEQTDRGSGVLPRAAARLRAGPRARRLDRRRGRGPAPDGTLAPSRAGARPAAIARGGASAEHLDLDAPVGLQAVDQLAVLALLGTHALTRRASYRLRLALARHFDVLRGDLAIEIVLHRL